MAPNDFLAAAVKEAIVAAGVPVETVDIGNPTNKATWTATLPGVTPGQQATIAATIAAFDLPGFPARLNDAQAISDVDLKVLRAISQALWECIPAPTKTLVQLRARAIAIWKTL